MSPLSKYKQYPDTRPHAERLADYKAFADAAEYMVRERGIEGFIGAIGQAIAAVGRGCRMNPEDKREFFKAIHERTLNITIFMENADLW